MLKWRFCKHSTPLIRLKRFEAKTEKKSKENTVDSFGYTRENRMKQIVSYGALWLWRQTSETNADGREVGEKRSVPLHLLMQSSYDFIYSSFEILLKTSLKKNYAF